MDVTGGSYGSSQQYQQIRSAAPLAQAPGVPPAPTATPSPMSQVVPMGQPTQRPGEPITAGAALGDGPGPTEIGLSATPASRRDALRAQYGKYLPVLLRIAQQKQDPAYTQWVRGIWSEMM